MNQDFGHRGPDPSTTEYMGSVLAVMNQAAFAPRPEQRANLVPKTNQSKTTGDPITARPAAGNGELGSPMREPVTQAASEPITARPSGPGGATPWRAPVEPGQVAHRAYGMHNQGRAARLSISLATHQAHMPEYPALQGNGRIVGPSQGVHRDFDDGSVIGYGHLIPHVFGR